MGVSKWNETGEIRSNVDGFPDADNARENGSLLIEVAELLL